MMWRQRKAQGKGQLQATAASAGPATNAGYFTFFKCITMPATLQAATSNCGQTHATGRPTLPSGRPGIELAYADRHGTHRSSALQLHKRAILASQADCAVSVGQQVAANLLCAGHLRRKQVKNIWVFCSPVASFHRALPGRNRDAVLPNTSRNTAALLAQLD